MKKYNQLSQRERDLIDVLSRKGESCAAIGKKLKRDKSTIARELKRNSSSKVSLLSGSKSQRKEKPGCPQEKVKESPGASLCVSQAQRRLVPGTDCRQNRDSPSWFKGQP
jgi:IS30 family transposase